MAPMSLVRSVALNTASLVAGRVLAVLAGFGAIALASRYLTQDGYGQLTVAMALVSLFAVITDLGISTMATRQIAREPDREREILGTVLSLGLVLSVGVIALTLAVAFAVYPGPRHAPIREGVAILAAQILVAPFVSAARAHFIAGQRGYLMASTDFAFAFAMFAFTAAAVLADGGYRGVVIAVSAAYVLQAAVAVVLTTKGLRLAWHAERRTWTDLLRLSLPLGGAMVVNYLYFRLDVLLLSVMRTERDVAIYGVAYRVVEAFMVLPAYFMLTLFPEIARLSEQPGVVDRIVAEALKVMQLVALPIVLLTALFAPQIVVVIGGESYADAAPVLQILMVGVGVSYMTGVYGNALPALGQQREFFKWSVVVLVINLALNLVLIPPFGVIGAAVAVLLSELAVFAIIRWLYSRVGTPARVPPSPRVMAAAAIMTLVVSPKFLLDGAPPLALAVAGGALGLLAYLLALAWLRALPETMTAQLPPRLARALSRT
jgi:O-antigen/teichoic acid export membrane protein